eukprot:tig00000441_g714.t1
MGHRSSKHHAYGHRWGHRRGESGAAGDTEAPPVQLLPIEPEEDEDDAAAAAAAAEAGRGWEGTLELLPDAILARILLLAATGPRAPSANCSGPLEAAWAAAAAPRCSPSGWSCCGRCAGASAGRWTPRGRGAAGAPRARPHPRLGARRRQRPEEDPARFEGQLLGRRGRCGAAGPAAGLDGAGAGAAGGGAGLAGLRGALQELDLFFEAFYATDARPAPPRPRTRGLTPRSAPPAPQLPLPAVASSWSACRPSAPSASPPASPTRTRGSSWSRAPPPSPPAPAPPLEAKRAPGQALDLGPEFPAPVRLLRALAARPGGQAPLRALAAAAPLQRPEELAPCLAAAAAIDGLERLRLDPHRPEALYPPDTLPASASAECLRPLSSLSALQSLGLGVPLDSLEFLVPLTRLEHLRLALRSSADCSPLAGLPCLRTLSLYIPLPSDEASGGRVLGGAQGRPAPGSDASTRFSATLARLGSLEAVELSVPESHLSALAGLPASPVLWPRLRLACLHSKTGDPARPSRLPAPLLPRVAELAPGLRELVLKSVPPLPPPAGLRLRRLAATDEALGYVGFEHRYEDLRDARKVLRAAFGVKAEPFDPTRTDLCRWRLGPLFTGRDAR